MNTETPYTISTTGDEGGCLASELGTCSEQPATWDNRNTVDILATIPAGVAFPEGMTPETIEFRMCFAPSSTVDRKWRSIKPEFKARPQLATTSNLWLIVHIFPASPGLRFSVSLTSSKWY